MLKYQLPHSQEVLLPSSAIIEISGLSHTYPGTRTAPVQPALSEVDLAVQAGEKVALLGPNGSGKSTLLRVLMTALKPDKGTVRIDGMDLDLQADQIRKLIGVVFQKPALDIKMTVWENLRAAGMLYRIPRAQLEERGRSLLERLGLSQRRRTLVGALSGGLARRVELARALLSQPLLLILDEPTTGLDPVARREFWRQVETLRAETPMTVVLTTHLLEEAQDCDRVAILHQGRVLAYDHPGHLQQSIGTEVLQIRGDDLQALGREIGSFLGLESRVVDQSVRLSLSGPTSLDALLDRFGGRIRALSLAHPSLDDVFVQLTGEHLQAEEVER
ncbi:MAG: ABC transporter ATP-binding protein [Candidatus Latescibacteria bacterium]|nr:ABC transporter ATP-binding protein [Candidatus Latescibacterota bacterium]